MELIDLALSDIFVVILSISTEHTNKGPFFFLKYVKLYHICTYIYVYTDETWLRGFTGVSPLCTVFSAGQELVV